MQAGEKEGILNVIPFWLVLLSSFTKLLPYFLFSLAVWGIGTSDVFDYSHGLLAFLFAFGMDSAIQNPRCR
jgi:hypothetical protein